MWSRKRIDIGWGGIACGLLRCLFSGKAADHERRIASHLPDPGKAVICLSVRSGFDLLLASLKLPRGGEVLLSALTLGHMAEIVRAHGLVPVPVDLDPVTMLPDPEALENALGPDTRMLVVAHLFGGCPKLGEIVEICRRNGLFLVEDMAQAFRSRNRWGDVRSDAAMFSFGTIKTATAGGGAVLLLRDQELAGRINDLQESYAMSSRSGFALKLCRISLLKALGYRIPYAVFRRACGIMGIDADDVLSRGTRAFPGTQMLERIRQKPHPALLALLSHRIGAFDPRMIRRRTLAGRLLRDQLTGELAIPGGESASQTFWVFPVLAEDPEGLIRKLVAEGFDATVRQSMVVIGAPDEMHAKPVATAGMVRRMVFLPAYPEMGEPEIRRMAWIVSAHCAGRHA